MYANGFDTDHHMDLFCNAETWLQQEESSLNDGNPDQSILILMLIFLEVQAEEERSPLTL